MTDEDRYRTWTQHDEMQFVERLGSWSEVGKIIGRKKLLRRYLKTINKRKWPANIDKKAIWELAKGMLEEVRGENGKHQK